MLIGLLLLASASYPFYNFIWANTVERAEAPYVIGVFPYISLGELERVFVPVIRQLETALNLKIRFRSSSSFERFKVRLAEKAFDIAFVQPFDYVLVAAPKGYRPVANINMPLSAVLVTDPASRIQKVEDLRHHVIALPPPSAAVSYLVKRLLRQNKIDAEQDVELKYVKTHDACLQEVLLGTAGACGTAPYPMSLFEKQMDVKFRVLTESEKIPGSVFIVRATVPEKNVKKIKDTLIAMTSEVAGNYWGNMGLHHPFKSIQDADFDQLRRILDEE